MKLNRIIRSLLLIIVLGANIGCDQISKNIVRHNMYDHETISLADNHLTLIKVENTGAFLSLGHSLPQAIKLLALIILPLIILGVSLLLVTSRRYFSNITATGICFVIGGGIGNIYDRIMYGSVTDFLHIDFGIFQTGIFNMADVSIMTGMFIIVFESLLLKHFKTNKSNQIP